MINKNVNDFINEISNIDDIVSIVLGGSMANDCSDNISDYDFYIYSSNKINQETRIKIFSKHCKYYEIGHDFWELGDNGILNCGIEIEIIYRDLQFLENYVANVIEKCIPNIGFTTCFWHNVLTSKIIYDKNDYYKKMKERFSIPYPKELKENIIKRNMALLSGYIISYDKQIEHAVYRKDLVNINNRISVFLASYFDIIFAINELQHPGEKRLIEICKNKCNILPNKFEENISNLFNNEFNTMEILNNIINELKIII